MLKARFIAIINKEVQIYDAETTYKELFTEALINFMYGFVANVSTPLIVVKHDLGVFVSFMLYYFTLSYILNRDKYETKLARYVLMPLPCIVGAFTSYKLGYWIMSLIS